MAQSRKTWGPVARVLWIVLPVAVLAGLVAFILWPRPRILYSDGKRTWPARPDLGLRSVLWDAGDVVAGLGETDQDYDPCLSGDGQELYFTRGKAGANADIYVSYRTLDGWTAPKPLAEINSPADEIGPALARDGATLYFYSNRPGGEGAYDLYVSRHSDQGWSPPKNLGPRVNTPFNEYDPSVTPDGTHLLFASNRPVPGKDDIDETAWRATLREEPYQNDYDLYAVALDDPSAPVRRLEAVSSAANDGQPTLSPDGKWLYFASDRADGHGGYDLWRSRITVPPLAGLMPPDNLDRPINTPANELDPAVSLEGFGLYFSSNRARPETYAIYYARSHEVFALVQKRPLAIGRIIGRLSWPLIGLIAALVGLALTLLALARLRRRPGLLSTAMMVSLILHLVALSLFTIWQISYRVSELAEKDELYEVAVTIPGLAESELSSELRAALADLARTDSAELAVEKSETITEPRKPEPPAPEIALAALEPVRREIEIATLPEEPEPLEEPLKPEVRPAQMPEPLPPEPLPTIQPKAVRPAVPVEIAQPRDVTVARAEPVPVRTETPVPRPPMPRRVEAPPEPVPLALPEVRSPEAMPLEVDLGRPPEPAQAEAVVDMAPVPSELPVRPVRVAPEPTGEAVSIRPLAAGKAETPVPEPVALVRAPEAGAPPVQPAIDTTLLTEPTAAPRGADAAAVIPSETLARGPAIAPADVEDTPSPAAGPAVPKRAAPLSNGEAESAPSAPALLAIKRAEGPVALAPAPRVAGPVADEELRLGPEAVGAEALTSALVAAPPSAPRPTIEVEAVATNPTVPIPAAIGPVDLTPSVALQTPRAVLPERPPVVVGPRQRLAAARQEAPTAAAPAKAGTFHVTAKTADLSSPEAKTLLASAAPIGESLATPVVGDSVVVAALPPAAPVEADIGAPPAPLPPKEIYRLRTEPDRTETIEKLGGTPETEEAVRRALVWFARHQSEDGHWDINEFMNRYDENGRRADGPGDRDNQNVGVTALATLAFVGAGHTHKPTRGASGPSEYAACIERAINWLITGQKEDGDLRRRGQMYDHCIATMVLCESYSMTGDERLAEPIRRAVDFILKAQNPNHGWRYEPRSDNDTSVVGWALMALKSAEIAGFEVPTRAYRGAANWLDKVRQGQHKGLYEYQPGRGPSPAMTAEGLFSEMLIQYRPDSPRTAESVEYCLKHEPVWRPQNTNDTNFYYWYYATLALHQLGGPKWDEWNRKVRDTLVKAQRTDGPFAGSWDPRSRWGQFGGRVYTTALAALTLEVYYRYLPFYDLKLGNQN